MSTPPGAPRSSSTGLASCSSSKTRSGPSAVTRSRSGIRRPSSGCPAPRSWRMSSPEIIPASSLRGSSRLASSDTKTTRACMRSSRRWSVPRAIVYWSARAATGWQLVPVGVQEALRGRPSDDLRQLPAQIHRILHTEAESLSTRRVMHMRRVAGEQDASRVVVGGVAGHVGEPRDPRGIVDPEVGAEHRDQRLAEIAQGGFAARSDLLLSHDDAHRLPVLHPVQAVTPVESWRGLGGSSSVVSTSPIRLLLVAPQPGNSMPAALGRHCVLRRTRRGTAPAAPGRRTTRRRRRRRPA